MISEMTHRISERKDAANGLQILIFTETPFEPFEAPSLLYSMTNGEMKGPLCRMAWVSEATANTIERTHQKEGVGPFV